MDALALEDGSTLYERGYLKLLEAAQSAGVEVGI